MREHSFFIMENTFTLYEELQEKINEIYPLKNIEGWLSALGLQWHLPTRTVEVYFPHMFFGAWFAEEAQYYFEKALCEVIFSAYALTPHIVYKKAPPKQHTSPILTQNTIRQQTDYFEEFIHNTKNEFPLALLREMAQKPFVAKYNPFIMYGSTSTGKTQILQCLTKALHKIHALEQRLFYGNTEDFSTSLSTLGARGLCQKYDFFIIDTLDNIQPLLPIQIIFKDFLEACVAQKIQMVFASTISPEQEKDLDNSLRSRLNAGLVVQLKNSDIDVRMRFVVKYAKQLGIKLSKEHILLLAQRCKNIAMLRGVLLKIEAFSQLHQGTLQTIDMENILRPFADEEKNLTPDAIVSCIASYFEMNEEHILGNKRDPDMVRARQVSMYLCRDLLGLSYPAIGKVFGGKDHSTVMYAIKKIKKLTDTNKNMQHMVTEIKRKCMAL